MGCAFPDWLARFFIRISKSPQLSAQRSETEILVDRVAASDPNLVLFLENFSYATKIAPLDAHDFVAELERRWFARHPRLRAAESVAHPPAALPDMPPGA